MRLGRRFKAKIGACPIERQDAAADLETAGAAALRALLAIAERSSAPVLWARSEGIWAASEAFAPPAGGDFVAGAPWSKQQHDAAWQALAHPMQLHRSFLAQRLDDAVVVLRAPAGGLKLDALCQSGFISSLAARTLSAALRLGRNIVWTGPQRACDQAMTLLAAKGRHPGVWSTAPTPVPEGFVTLDDAQTVWRAGIDRLVAPASTPQQTLAMLSAQAGAQAWVCAGRLDRTLMRLELACAVGASEAATQILAAVDLVVVVENHDAPRVTSIAELVLIETGYRPACLFTTGHAAAPQALIPVQAPSFVATLQHIDEQTLAADLSYATQRDSSASTPPQPQNPPASAGPVHGRAAAAPNQTASRANRPPNAALTASAVPVGAAGEPGWELDRLFAAQPDTQIQAEPSADVSAEPSDAAEAAQAASLAAQFGLGPPPRPRPRAGGPTLFGEVLQHMAGDAEAFGAAENALAPKQVATRVFKAPKQTAEETQNEADRPHEKSPKGPIEP